MKTIFRLITLIAIALFGCVICIQAAEKEKYTGEMITIPAGNFIMGNNNGETPERPEHSVYLPTYQIGKYEVTRGEFKKFIEAGGYDNPKYWSKEGWEWKEGNVVYYAEMYGKYSKEEKPAGFKRTEPECWAPEQNWGSGKFIQTDKHPVVGVTYYEAEAYCKWAGGRLPTEAEWEKAGRWDAKKKHSNLFPWGDKWDVEMSKNGGDNNPAGGGRGKMQSAPVGSYPKGASAYGCMDMQGNAYEWSADWAKSYPGSEMPFDFTDKYHMVRGGCWDDGERSCSWRGWYLPPFCGGTAGSDSDHIGFRVVKI